MLGGFGSFIFGDPSQTTVARISSPIFLSPKQPWDGPVFFIARIGMGQIVGKLNFFRHLYEKPTMRSPVNRCKSLAIPRS